MDVDIGQPGEFRVPRVHAPDMRSEWHLAPLRIVGVVEVVVSLRVGAERGIILVRRERQRRAAAPAADQLRGEQFALFLGTAVLAEESIERADTRLVFAEAHIGAVATEDVWPRHWQRHPGFAGIPKDELAGFDRPPLARQRVGAAALDRRLVDAVLVAQRIEITRLGAEVLHRQDADARDALVLLTSDREGTLVLFLGIAECTHADVDLARPERLVPRLRIVDAVVAELLCARRHPDAESLGEALQRVLGNAERFEARIADPDIQPSLSRVPPIR